MKYIGGKSRIANRLMPYILKEYGSVYLNYVEPFSGGLNSMAQVPANGYCYRYGNDNNEFVIALQKYYQSCGYIPDSWKGITFEEYNELRSLARVDKLSRKLISPELDAQIGFAGFICSFNGKFMQGYTGDKVFGKRDMFSEALRSFEKTMSKCMDVVLTCGDYMEMLVPEQSIIYCDIPYRMTQGYTRNGIAGKNDMPDFWYDVFWEWARCKTKEGNAVYVSEYSAPEDFTCVFQTETILSMCIDTVSREKRIEKLFTYQC